MSSQNAILMKLLQDQAKQQQQQMMMLSQRAMQQQMQNWANQEAYAAARIAEDKNKARKETEKQREEQRKRDHGNDVAAVTRPYEPATLSKAGNKN